MKPLKINFEGLLKSPSSWAKVNRKLLGALLSRNDVKLAVQPRRGFGWSESFSIDDRLIERPEKHEDPDICLTFTYPPLLNRVTDSESYHFLLSLYEASKLPPGWVDPLKKFEGTIVVPSNHVHSIYREEPISEENMFVVSLGYDPEIFFPGDSTSSSNRKPQLLTVGTPHYRKGLDYLLGLSDLAGSNDIKWKVHSHYEPDVDGKFWESPRILSKLRDAGFEVTTGSFSDWEIAEMMRGSDLVVQPSRSEGFGLVILEAMACGTPVVTANWGGHLDFAGKGMIRIEGALRPAGRAQYDERRPGAKVFDINPIQFRHTIRELIASPEIMDSLGNAARETVEDLTWQRSAHKLAKIMSKQTD